MKIPYLLILLKFIFAPFILMYYFGNEAINFIVVLTLLGLLSDIFDGVIARKQNISPVKLRHLDSQTEIKF